MNKIRIYVCFILDVSKLLLEKCTNVDILYTNRSRIYLGMFLSVSQVNPRSRPEDTVQKLKVSENRVLRKIGKLRLAISREPFVVGILFFAYFDSAGDSLRESGFRPRMGRCFLKKNIDFQN